MSSIATGKIFKYNLERLRYHLSPTPFDVEEAIGIFGTPRSGTTWLMELISAVPGYLSLFEPLHPYWFPDGEVRCYQRPYFSPFQEMPDYKKYLHNVFQGDIISKNPHFKLNDLPRRFFSSKILSKFIRANRILPWIAYNIEFKGAILIVRHPCATIASQFNTGITGYIDSSKDGLVDKIITSDIILSEAKNIVPDDIYKIIKTLDDRASLYALAWALDHYIPLFYRNDKVLVISYEKMVEDPENQLKFIFKCLGIEKIPKNSFEGISKASMSSDEDYFSNNKEKQLSKWKKILSQKEQDNIFNVLELFDIDYYSDSIFPDMDRLNNWTGTWEPKGHL